MRGNASEVFVLVFVWWNTWIRSGIYLESLTVTGFAIRTGTQLKSVVRHFQIAGKELVQFVILIHMVHIRCGSYTNTSGKRGCLNRKWTRIKSVRPYIPVKRATLVSDWVTLMSTLNLSLRIEKARYLASVIRYRFAQNVFVLLRFVTDRLQSMSNPAPLVDWSPK